MRRCLGALHLVVFVAACGGPTPVSPAAEPLAARRVEPDTAIAEPLAAVGRTLLARAPTDEEIGEAVSDTLLRSADGGRTWAPVVLPDRPPAVAFGPTSPLVTGDVAVVTGRGIVATHGLTVDAGDAYVWTSTRSPRRLDHQERPRRSSQCRLPRHGHTPGPWIASST